MYYKKQAELFTRFPNPTMKYLLDILVETIKETRNYNVY